MRFNKTQLEWINKNEEWINNKELDKVKDEVFSDNTLSPFEKRQLIAGLAIIFDLSFEIVKTRIKGERRIIIYSLYVKDFLVKLAEYQVSGSKEPTKKDILRDLCNKLLIENGIDGQIQQEIIERVEYNVD